MRIPVQRVSISWKLSVFLAVWTTGTLAAVGLYNVWLAQEIQSYHRVLEILTTDAQRFHRILDAKVPLGTAGREQFRAMRDSADAAMAALQDGGQFQDIQCPPIPQELGGMLEEIGLRWTPTRRAIDIVLASAEQDEMPARTRLHRFFPAWQSAVQRIQRSLQRREGTIRTHTMNVLAVIASANLVLLVVVLLLIRRFITRPVHAVRAAASRIASGDFSTPVPVAGRDEISELATEFNRMSEQLQASMNALRTSADELTRTNRELEEYAYAAAHDLQEPARVISLYAQLLRKRSSLTPESAQFTAQIETSAERMLRIVNDLLVHSRSTHEPTRSLPSDADKAVREALAHHGAMLDATGATVRVDPMPPVLANEPDLELVFRNLIGNSLKYRGEARPEIHISAQANGDSCMFRVRDNGIGIAPEYHDRVFGLFKRLHGHEIPGTGVGLAITKKLIEKHGGRIWVESEFGKGATFVFELRPAEATIAATSA